MKKLLLLTVILGILLVSGCTATNELMIQNAGGIIKDLSFDFGSVYDDEQSVLSVEVQNVGGKDIPATTLYVYGQTFGATNDVWQVVNANPAVDQEIPFVMDNIAAANFQPPDAEQGIPGEGQMYTFVLQTPNMLDGIPPVEQNFYAKLCYPYSTSTLTQVDLTSKNEMRANPITNTPADTINAAGPIQLELKTQKNIRPSLNALPLVFSVKDVGGGFSTLGAVACSVDTPTSDRNWATVSVSVDGVAADCGTGQVLLKKGEGTIYCTYTFGAGVAPKTSYRVVATATYNYYVEKAVSIQVQDSPVD